MDTSSPAHDLTYEETPVIEPIPASDVKEVSTPEVLSPPKTHSSFGSTLGMIILFVILFAIGVGLSVVLRQYFASRSEAPPQTAIATPTPTIAPSPYVNALTSPTASPTAAIVGPYVGGKTYQVISGATKQPVLGISFKLPADVLAPMCDGATCASQGTYLPGGSRFTVAPRGKGQLLIDARGNVGLTDSSGKSFTVKQMTLQSGRKALEYTGDFRGSTVGGYTFSQMRGFMIEIDEGVTLEMNHFAPSGVSAEFTEDDVIFDEIIASLTVARFPQATGIPTP